MSAALRVLILSGPTREPIDPVRYISSASSGRLGAALAAEAIRRGHAVEIIQGPVELDPPPGARVTRVLTAREMLEAAVARHPFCDLLIGAAAVSDYRAAAPSPRKHKRTPESWSIELVPNPDILAELGRAKGRRIHVGFALESERLLEGARRKLEEKNLDWIVCNSPEAIGAEAADFTILGRDGSRRDLGRLRKEEMAAVLLDLVEA